MLLVFLLLPTLGPFHIMHPRYNAVTVLELVKAYQPTQILLASYSPDELAAQSWREDNEVSFFHVLPWAQRVDLPVIALDKLSHLKQEADAFRQALSQYPKGQQILQQLASLEASLSAFLAAPRTLDGLVETLRPVTEYLEGRARLLGEGPATGFRQERMKAVSDKLLASHEPAAVLVDLLDYPVLIDLLPPASYLLLPPHTPTEAERQRSVLDRAWRLEESDDWGALLQHLQEVESPEAIYCAAQIYLAAGQIQDAFGLLEQLVHSDFQHPQYLPGYTLARYGQLADLMGEREKALRAYAAVLALAWVPLEAREIALAGSKAPLKLGQ